MTEHRDACMEPRYNGCCVGGGGGSLAGNSTTTWWRDARHDHSVTMVVRSLASTVCLNDTRPPRYADPENSTEQLVRSSVLTTLVCHTPCGALATL